MNSRVCLMTAGISGAAAVALGALGAHALSGSVSAELLESYKTANAYHMYHTLALPVLPVLKKRIGNNSFNLVFYLWTAGMILFSGSIYLLSVRHVLEMSWLSKLGPVTPFGGVLLIMGWIFLAVAGFKSKHESRKQQ